MEAFLREWGYEALVSQYNLIFRRHSEWDNLCLFKYKQVNSPLHVSLCCGAVSLEGIHCARMPRLDFRRKGELEGCLHAVQEIL